MDAPSFGLHPMTGDRKAFCAVVISRTWRVIFCFEGGKAPRYFLAAQAFQYNECLLASFCCCLSR